MNLVPMFESTSLSTYSSTPLTLWRQSAFPMMWKSEDLSSRYAAGSSPCETLMIFRNVECEQNSFYYNHKFELDRLFIRRYEHFFFFFSFIPSSIKLCLHTSDNYFIVLGRKSHTLFLQDEKIESDVHRQHSSHERTIKETIGKFVLVRCFYE